MKFSRESRLGLCALALGPAALAALFHQWGMVGAALGFILIQVYHLPTPAVNEPSGRHVLRLVGLDWTLDEFLTHWAIIGRSGCGKTAGVIRTIFIQLLHSVPDFGCIAIDEKANFHKVLARLCAAQGRADKLIVLRPRRPGSKAGQPLPYTMNLIGDRTIPWETYAQLVIDTAVACGQETNNAFFKNQGRKTIVMILATLEVINVTPTLGLAYDFISDDQCYRDALADLKKHARFSVRARELQSFWDSFEAKGADEKSGIKSTTELYLNPYEADELRDLFGAEKPTVELRVIDEGKILCPSIPQDFLTQRRYITAWFKFAAYYHLLRRFDDFDEDQREKLTPILLLADEGQNSILASEEGLADHNTLDKIREARGTLILAMQSYASVLPALKGRRDLAESIFTNLNNHVIGAIRDETGREMAANIFGKEWQKDRSYSYGGTNNSTSIRSELRHVFHTGIFARIPKFKCIVFHVTGHWSEGWLPPLTDDGKGVSPRFRLGLFRRLSRS